MTFYEWCKTRKIRNSVSGDFISDVLSDRDFPKEMITREQLLSYLQSKPGVCYEAIRVSKQLWTRYQIFEKRLDEFGEKARQAAEMHLDPESFQAGALWAKNELLILLNKLK
jgi:hypothetical protein